MLNSDSKTRHFTLEITPQDLSARKKPDAVRGILATFSPEEQFELGRTVGRLLAERLQEQEQE